jgi:hypothetical protein
MPLDGELWVANDYGRELRLSLPSYSSLPQEHSNENQQCPPGKLGGQLPSGYSHRVAEPGEQMRGRAG